MVVLPSLVSGVCHALPHLPYLKYVCHTFVIITFQPSYSYYIMIIIEKRTHKIQKEISGSEAVAWLLRSTHSRLKWQYRRSRRCKSLAARDYHGSSQTLFPHFTYPITSNFLVNFMFLLFVRARIPC